MVGIEDLDEQALRKLAGFYVRLAQRAKEQAGVKERHSIDEEQAKARGYTAQTG
ncbi:hypothetical protein ABIC42_005811 [Variovorax sp. 1133]